MLSIPVSIALLVVYVARHGVCAAPPPDDPRLERRGDRDLVVPHRRSLVLGVATVATAFVAEILVGSLEAFSEKVGLSDFFVAAVIVAIVGNAAEHGGAVIVAYRGKIKLAAEIALTSAAQVAVFLIPAVVLLSWLIEPLALGFRPVEIGALDRVARGRRAHALGRRLVAAPRLGPDRLLRRASRSRSPSPATASASGREADGGGEGLRARGRSRARCRRRSRSRWVTARMCVGPVGRRERDARFAEPASGLVAADPEPAGVDLDEVRLDPVELDGEPGRVPRLGEPPGPGVVVREPLDVVVERVQPRRGDHPCLAQRAAEQVLLPPRPLEQRARGRRGSPPAGSRAPSTGRASRCRRSRRSRPAACRARRRR